MSRHSKPVVSPPKVHPKMLLSSSWTEATNAFFDDTLYRFVFFNRILKGILEALNEGVDEQIELTEDAVYEFGDMCKKGEARS